MIQEEVSYSDRLSEASRVRHLGGNRQEAWASLSMLERLWEGRQMLNSDLGSRVKTKYNICFQRSSTRGDTVGRSWRNHVLNTHWSLVTSEIFAPMKMGISVRTVGSWLAYPFNLNILLCWFESSLVKLAQETSCCMPTGPSSCQCLSPSTTLMTYCTPSSYSLDFLVACIHWLPDTSAGSFSSLLLTPQVLWRGIEEDTNSGQKIPFDMGVKVVVLLVSQDLEYMSNPLLMRI